MPNIGERGGVGILVPATVGKGRSRLMKNKSQEHKMSKFQNFHQEKK